jgi:hypothetical protein
MSTKTTFKRLALVAVAALGFGVVPAISAVAAVPLTADTVTIISSTTAVTVGGTSSVTVKLSGICQGAVDWGNSANFNVYQVYLESFSAIPTSYAKPIWAAVADGGAGSSTDRINLAALDAHEGDAANRFNITLGCQAAGPYVGYATISWTPVTVGSYTFTIASMPNGDGTFNGYGKASYTVTAAAKGAITAAASTLTASATTITGSRAIADAPIGNVVVAANNAAGDADAATTSAVLSGAGLISFASDGTGKARAISSSGNSKTIYFYGDGTAGVGTVSISSGTTVLGSASATFYGSVASLTAAVKKPVANTGAATTGVIEVVAKDSAGVVVPAQGLTITSGTTATIASFTETSSTAGEAALGTASVDVTGVASTYGSVVLTIKDTATGLVSTTATVTVSTPVASTVSVAFDKSEYLPGEKATLTITAKDANGLVVANSLANVGDEYSWSQNLSTASTLPVAAAFSNGAQAITVYMPASYGTFTVIGKLIAGDAWSTALDDTTITASATVINPAADQAQAATDAAAEATDAANAATDAANAAAEAADAATAAAQDAADAVAALSTQVAEMIDALKKQITALTNLVIKIQKKVKA